MAGTWMFDNGRHSGVCAHLLERDGCTTGSVSPTNLWHGCHTNVCQYGPQWL